MKKPPPGTEEKVAKMTFASVYPHYVAKVEKKGRTNKEPVSYTHLTLPTTPYV